MSKILRITCAIVAIVALAIGSYGAVRKPAKAVKRVKATVVKIPSGPKVLSIVAGQPFQSVPSSGSSKLSVTMCTDETGPATFTVKCGKTIAGVTIKSADLLGPGKIGKENVTARVVSGNDLVSADGIEIGPSPLQIWLDITVPKNAKPGTYKGYVSLSAAGKQIDVEPYDVVVRSLWLRGSSRQYAIYTDLGPSGDGACCVSGADYAAFLSEAAKLGFRAVAVNADCAKVGDAMNTCASAGLVGAAPVVSFAKGCGAPSADDVKAIEAARKAAGIGSVFCFCASEPNSDTEVNAAVEKAGVFRRAGMQVGVTVSDDATLQKLMPVVDGINYKYDMPYVQALINGGTNRTNKWEWYWWDANRSVSDNRIRSGIALWRSGLYGCMPVWTPNGSGKASLDCLQCEALREGINDTRYITTYMKALRELKDKKRQGDKEYIATTESYLAAFLSKPLDKVTPADLRAFRAKMVEFSNKLAAMVH